MTDYVEESLVYERAITHVNRALATLRSEKKLADRAARDAGEPSDISFEIAIDDLSKLRAKYQRESDKLWREAEKDMYEGAKPWENLANAVIQQAIKDYEVALCADNRHTILSVRRFAERGGQTLTKVNLPAVLHKIDEAHKEFSALVAKRGAEIVEESQRLKAAHKKPQDGHIRCPLCGGALYDKAPEKKTHLINCTGCSLSRYWTEESK